MHAEARENQLPEPPAAASASAAACSAARAATFSVRTQPMKSPAGSGTASTAAAGAGSPVVSAAPPAVGATSTGVCVSDEAEVSTSPAAARRAAPAARSTSASEPSRKPVADAARDSCQRRIARPRPRPEQTVRRARVEAFGPQALLDQPARGSVEIQRRLDRFGRLSRPTPARQQRGQHDRDDKPWPKGALQHHGPAPPSPWPPR